MSDRILVPHRRLFLGTLGVSLFTTRGLFADELTAADPGFDRISFVTAATEGPS